MKIIAFYPTKKIARLLSVFETNTICILKMTMQFIQNDLTPGYLKYNTYMQSSYYGMNDEIALEICFAQ